MQFTSHADINFLVFSFVTFICTMQNLWNKEKILRFLFFFYSFIKEKPQTKIAKWLKCIYDRRKKNEKTVNNEINRNRYFMIIQNTKSEEQCERTFCNAWLLTLWVICLFIFYLDIQCLISSSSSSSLSRSLTHSLCIFGYSVYQGHVHIFVGSINWNYIISLHSLVTFKCNNFFLSRDWWLIFLLDSNRCSIQFEARACPNKFQIAKSFNLFFLLLKKDVR